ncbi:MAG TPA: glycosyltransferase [Cyclobacteriaceae bacterium]|jgi:glycosyltransferase involved in cell wall biosynthesis|nr:glycosyltransferase [Cyclobacteriaceae bacterium]
MINLGIVGLVNFNDWNDPNYTQTGGINSVVKSIVPYLKADKIILFGHTFDKDNLFKEKQIGENIYIFPILYIPPKTKFPIRSLAFLKGWRLNRYLKKHQINFAYTHSEELCFWVTFTKINYIHHIHTFVNVLEISHRRSSKIKLFKSIWSALRNRVINKAYRVVSINNDISNMITSRLQESRVIRFPNYVDTQQFKFRFDANLKSSLGITHEKIVLFVGRLAQVKGLELFVDTIQLLSNDPTNSWKAIIIGNGDYENKIRNYIEEKNLEDKFIFEGSVNDPVILSKYYSLANVFLVTSWSESGPVTLLESLACGTPVVSMNVGFANDVLNKNNGFVIDYRNAAEFSKKVMDSVSFKTHLSLLPDDEYYSVEHAANLLNKNFNPRI